MYVLPGQAIGNGSMAGEGSYCINQEIIASVKGQLEGKMVVNQKRKSVPTVNDIVVAMVTKITPISASVDIIQQNKIVLEDSFKGIIRRQDITAQNQDSLTLSDCFRPGDLVLAKVISFGDSRAYFLSTTLPEHGVIYAVSTYSRLPLIPYTAQLMRTREGDEEPRKVAKT